MLADVFTEPLARSPISVSVTRAIGAAVALAIPKTPTCRTRDALAARGSEARSSTGSTLRYLVAPEIRIVAGAATGGAGCATGLGSEDAGGFRGRKIATPQLGNTQDVSARAWLVSGGLRITLTGGDAQVVPTANADQLALFRRKQLDAVWTVEPWVSRLEMEAGGTVLLEETDAITTVLVSSAKLLGSRRDLVARFAAAHAELTDWISKNPEEAQKIVRTELTAEMRADVSPDLIARAWKRISLTTDVSSTAVEKFLVSAKSVGFLRTAPDLGRLVEKP